MEPIGLGRGELPPFLVKRREFLKSVGAGALAMPAIAGPFVRAANRVALAQDGVTSPDHFVPVDKKLEPAWVKALFEKGSPTIRRGEQRAACAMPVGGIGCGQIYAGPDGTLRTWEIFNRRAFSGWGQHNYEFAVPPRTHRHGFRIEVQRGEQTLSRALDESDVPDVEFLGQHPVATYIYPTRSAGKADPFPIEAKLETFAPFIPGNAADSTLPVTFFRVTLTNRDPVERTLTFETFLENATAPDTAELFGGRRTSQGEGGGSAEFVELRVDRAADAAVASSPPEVFADFEGSDYGAWKVEGTAFGTAPSKGTEPNQQEVSGFEGKGLVNSYRGEDKPTGKLTSPPFKIARRFINFRIGGGHHDGETCMNLVIGGSVVATATGKDREQLEWAHFDVRDHVGKEATLEIVDSREDAWGHVNVDQIEFGDTPRLGNGGSFESQPDYGQIGLVCFGWGLPITHGTTTTMIDGKPGIPVATASRDATLAPGDSITFESALIWHFPNAEHGHWYSARFKTWRELANYVVAEKDRLIGDTLAWRDAYYGGSLPCWLLERLHSPVANLQTNVTQVWKDGRFWAWEGVGCCEGTCTHVWNYEHATGRLFPELARSTREKQDLGAGFHDDGLVGYRGIDVYAADGQCGTVLKCWREHLMSADDGFLRRNWPRIKKVVEYLLRRDANDDGLLEDDQHNTYDIQFFGANTFVGSLYLAALRAAEEMSKLVGDADFAARCRKVFESGSKLTVEKLWNGEYFVQQVDLKEHPKDQYADGCLADQLFGQGWARQVGLGDLYPNDRVKQALRSIWKYCWAPDVGPQTARHVPERYFARRGEAGLFTCTWPKSKHLGDDGVRYRDEIWTGIEYQVAGHMIWEGLVEEGLAIIRGIHERYDGRLHNPWNEIECGDHYARAMASWGCYLALLGFEYDGPAGRIGFAPRVQQDDFKAAFTTAEGWGIVQFGEWAGRVLTPTPPPKIVVEIVRGTLLVRELGITLGSTRPWRSTVGLIPGFNGKALVASGPGSALVADSIPHDLTQVGDRIRLRLKDSLRLEAGDLLTTWLEPA